MDIIYTKKRSIDMHASNKGRPGFSVENCQWECMTFAALYYIPELFVTGGRVEDVGQFSNQVWIGKIE